MGFAFMLCTKIMGQTLLSSEEFLQTCSGWCVFNWICILHQYCTNTIGIGSRSRAIVLQLHDTQPSPKEQATNCLSHHLLDLDDYDHHLPVRHHDLPRQKRPGR